MDIYLSGTCKWAKLYELDTKFEPKWSINLYPDEHSWEKIRKYGVPQKMREDNDGKYITLSRRLRGWVDGKETDLSPPKVLDANNNEFTEQVQIGNGSGVTCKIELYKGKKGNGSRLLAVRVDNLVEYNPGDTDVESPF